MHEFIGKLIEEMLIEKDHSTMFWKVDGSWYQIDAIGDCCSYSWFQHCDNADALRGATMLEFNNVGVNDTDLDDPSNDNYIQVNMLNFVTNKGHCTIEFRNESNGYYTGWTEVRECTEKVVGNSVEPTSGRQLMLDRMEDF